MLCQQMTFAAAARLVGESRHRVAALCERYVELALAQADFSTVRELAIDETSARADMTTSRWPPTPSSAACWRWPRAAAPRPSRRWLASWPAAEVTPASQLGEYRHVAGVHQGCGEHLPNARITFDKFHVVWHASTAVDKMRRIEQRSGPLPQGHAWSLLKDRSRLSVEAAATLAP